jgi:hypothetical protein
MAGSPCHSAVARDGSGADPFLAQSGKQSDGQSYDWSTRAAAMNTYA